MNPSTIIHQPSTRRKAAILALLCAAVIAVFVLIPRGPGRELEPYTSSPLDARGWRLHVLIPSGWTHKLTRDPSTVGLKSEYLLEAASPEPWVPRWARGVLRVQHEEAGLTILWIPNPRFFILSQGKHPNHIPAGLAAVGKQFWIDGKGMIYIEYWRSDAMALHDTTEAVFDSVKVL